MRPTLLLFDLDGTLINTGGAGRRAIERAFALHTGRADACKDISFGGMTDRAIVRAGLVAVRHEATERAIDALLASYIEVLEGEVMASQGYSVYPGVEAVLDAGEAAGCAVGLGTGNVREGARIKLSRSGLFERFTFGGFGCDDERRDQILRMGAMRGAANLGLAVSACRVVVIGDTPKDIEAAKAISAESIAVATGPYTRAQLLTHAPTYLFENLAETGAIEALVG